MKTDTILITGATGTVGSELVRALANRGATVRAGVHSVIKGDRLKHLNPEVQLVELAFERPETLVPAFTGVDRVFLITPFSPEQVAVARQLIDAAKAAGVKQVVKLSALGAEAEPGIQLGRWHREAEQYLAQSGLSYAIVRPSSFMQNFITYHADGIRQQGAIYLPLGQGRLSYIDAQDIAAAAAAILLDDPIRHHGRAYPLTGSEALSTDEVARIIGQAAGRDVRYVDLPEDAARQGMQGAPQWLVDAMMELNAIGKAGYAATVAPDLERLTGRPARTFAEFAQDHRTAFAAA
ncbi:SDR family oxidoreductase [Hymenobacter busanensis]|uniref:SDR family oxidoreductase n=1 Tax=Hymenobacter busanensis TaxID=2607656 RepID=A0A7L5A224_9BACT|nr:SDR family oxidoreductase [Hymenobacter busanensis]KAA9338507.1 SDR family oxidoreductase [Hymenobacter busanensis]QHJ09065.1 NmrA family NAD(P)-binding protein [Hymenobacter busanensis]